MISAVYKLTEDEEKRTRWFFGKAYHWELNEAGKLTLKPGPTDWEEVRWAAADALIKKGMAPDTITAEMIDNVVLKATSAAILEAVASDGTEEEQVRDSGEDHGGA